MTVRWSGSLLAAAVWVVAASGCGDDAAAPPEKTKRVCDPGTVFSCFHSGCSAAHQSCNIDGTVMSKCQCDPAGTGGSGGDDDRDSGAAVDASEPIDAGDDFMGPVELRESDDQTPKCEGAFGTKQFEAGESPEADAASCEACTCSPTTAACAEFVDFSTGTEAGCGGTTCTTSVNQSCSEIMPPCLAGVSSAYLGTKLPSGSGGCTPSTPKPTKPDVSWSKRVVGCSAKASATNPKRAAGTALCVWREGEHDCPDKTYTTKHVYYRDVEDTRGCSACACSGPDCSYHWSVFSADDTKCESPILKLSSLDQCVQVNPAMDKLRVGASIEGDGSCTPSGGASEGDVTGSDEITVCCES